MVMKTGVFVSARNLVVEELGASGRAKLKPGLTSWLPNASV